MGSNGSGKSATLTAIGRRMVPIPDHISIYHLDREVSPSDVTALEAVTADLEAELERLEQEAEDLCVDDPESERLYQLYGKGNMGWNH